MTSQTLTSEIEFAYDVRSYQLFQQPHWADTARYDFLAKADAPTIAALKDLPFKQQLVSVREMVRRLLEDRCKLKVHWETRALSVFTLVVDKRGSKLQSVAADAPGSSNSGDGYILERGTSMGRFTGELERQPEMGNRKVVDSTGLSGFYNVMLRWQSINNTSSSEGSSLFTALPETLGLRPVPGKAAVKVMVVDHLEQPSEN